MPVVFRTTTTGIQQGPYSQLTVTPITNLTATSTIAGQIVLTWSGGSGYNVQYSYALSTGTIQSTSGINPTTITLTSTNQVTTTVTLTETVLGGSTNAVSNSITTSSPGLYLIKSNMHLINWYCPDSATITGGVVTSWNDSMGNYNLSNIGSGTGTTNYCTQVYASGTTSYVINQSSIAGSGTQTYFYGAPGYSTPIYCVVFCCNLNTGSSYYDNYILSNYSGTNVTIRYLSCGTLTTNANDFNRISNGYSNAFYINGVNIVSGNNIVTPPATFPTPYRIYCCYIQAPQQSSITQLSLLGTSWSANKLTGNCGDMFICDSGFGSTQQQQLEGYLGYKYKIQSSLPTNHPYYSATNSSAVFLS